MAETMTRAQAICACRNIVQLAKANDKAPDDFTSGVASRAADMEKGIIDRPQFPHITERMDTAIHNMWGGLRKWDRDDEFADDIYEDLDAVEAEIADLDDSAGNKPQPKGRETDDDEAKRRAAKVAGTQSGQRFPADEPNMANTPRSQEAPGPAPEGVGPGVIRLSDALRRKEAAVSFVLEQIHEAPITIIRKDIIRRMSIGDLLNMTKSDRTQQMLRMAYHVGVLRGINMLHGKLQNGDG